MRIISDKYKWVIVGALFVVFAMNWGIVFNTSSVFIIPVQNELNTDRAAMLLGVVIKGSVSVLAAMIGGRLMNKFGALNIMRVATVILVISFFAFSKIKTLSGYYVIISLHVFATTLSGFLPGGVIISEWFSGKNATVMALAFMGSGFGGMVFNVLTGNWISVLGWRNAAAILSIIMALVLLPVTFLILRKKPDSQFVLIDQYSVEMQGDSSEDVVRTTRFWWLLVGLTICCICSTGVVSNVSPSFQDLGYSLRVAAIITSATMVGMSIGKIVVGLLFDRQGLRRTSIIANMSMLICMIGLIFGRFTPGVIAAVIGFSVGAGYTSVSGPTLTLVLYGKKDFAKISGYMQGAFNFGGIIGPILMTPLYVAYGSYTPSWVLFAILVTINIFIFHKVLPNKSLSSIK